MKTFGDEIFSSPKVKKKKKKLIGHFGDEMFRHQYFQQWGISEKMNFNAKKQISSPKVIGDEKLNF